MEPHADTDHELEELENMVTYVKNIGASQWPAMLNRLEGATEAFIRECVSDMGTNKFTGYHTLLETEDSFGEAFDKHGAIQAHLDTTIPQLISREGGESDMDKAMLYIAKEDNCRVNEMNDETYRVEYHDIVQESNELFPKLDTQTVVEHFIKKYPMIETEKGPIKLTIQNIQHDNIGIFRLSHGVPDWQVERYIESFFNNKSKKWRSTLKLRANIPVKEGEDIDFTVLKSCKNEAVKGSTKSRYGETTASFFMIGWSGNRMPKKTRYF